MATVITTEPEIKDPAIKLLADRLTSRLSTQQGQIITAEGHEKNAKEYRSNAATYEPEIASLKKALRKLGHKV